MLYNCPICGEIESTDVKFTCLQCGNEGVTQKGDDVFICPNCGQIGADKLRMTCQICNSDDVTK